MDPQRLPALIMNVEDANTNVELNKFQLKEMTQSIVHTTTNVFAIGHKSNMFVSLN